MRKGKSILPGFLLSTAVGITSFLIRTYLFDQLGASTIAMLLGIVLGNLFFQKKEVFVNGTSWSQSRLLEISVVLLGATVTFQTIQQLHITGILFIIIQMIATIAFVLFLGKKLGFSLATTQLMAAGNAVCGTAAIAAASTTVDAKNEERVVSITVVNLMGTVLMLGLPALSGLIFGNNDFLRGALIGGTVQSVGQVVASAALVNPETSTIAALFKIIRIMFLIFIVLYFGSKRKGQTASEGIKVKKNILPWYVIGFLLFCILNSLLHFPTQLSGAMRFISTWCDIIALSAIGLRLNLVSFFKAGKNLLIYGFSTIAFQVALAIILIGILL